MEQKPPRKSKSQFNDYAKYSGLAIQMLATILICVFLGRQFDNWTHWKFPIGILSGMFLGLFGALYPVFKSTSNKN
jgi:F0F1-type ATP synthase assembly protein I